MTIGNNDHYLKLSEDLLTEILVRCSVKFLLLAKLICKRWYAHIASNDFIVEHLNHQKRYDKERLLLHYTNSGSGGIKVGLFDDVDRRTITPHVSCGEDYYSSNTTTSTYYDILKIYERSVTMEGPVDGLFCLRGHKERIVFWNPALMEFKTIPFPNPHFFPNKYIGPSEIGFGFSSSSDHDYKLVLVGKYEDWETQRFFCKWVTVYNLTTDTWRLLYDDDFPQDHSSYWLYNSDGSFMNGIYYWLHYEPRNEKGVVVSFNLRDEKFTKLSGPDCSCFPGHLTSYKGNLAFVVSSDRDLSIIDVWVMMLEAAAAAESSSAVWINQFSLLTSSFPAQNVSVFGLLLWKNIDAFFLEFEDSCLNAERTGYDYHMVMVNANNTREMKYMGPKGSYKFLRVVLYSESLVKVAPPPFSSSTASAGTSIMDKVNKRVSVNMLSKFLDYWRDPFLELARE